MKYNQFIPILPPRPTTSIPASNLGYYEKKKQIAQIKMNGTNNVIYVAPDRSLIALNRHKEKHKAWRFTKQSGKVFVGIPGNKWFVFNSELMHSKTPNMKDTNFIFDVFVFNGQYLLGETYRTRYNMLFDLLSDQITGEEFGYWQLGNNALLAKNITNGFGKVFDRLDRPEFEGLIIKDPEGVLTINSASDWLIRCRKRHANYPY